MNRDVNPILKPDPVECGCGCGRVGQPKVRAWSDGIRHVRACDCRRCRAPRHKQNASRRERQIAKVTGGAREPLSGALSGRDGSSGLWSWEETSAVAITRGFRRWAESKGVRAKCARLFARSGERHALILSWDGKPRWVVVPFESWVDRVLEDKD